MCLEVLAEVHLPHERRRRGWLRRAEVPAAGPGRYCYKGERAFRRGSLITRRSHQLACTHICGGVGEKTALKRGRREPRGAIYGLRGERGAAGESGGAEGTYREIIE